MGPIVYAALVGAEQAAVKHAALRLEDVWKGPGLWLAASPNCVLLLTALPAGGPVWKNRPIFQLRLHIAGKSPS
jgi:hypothetical protein